MRCKCGGEKYLDSFDPIKRPVEWFMRCLECGEAGPSYSSPEAAQESEKESA